ncbi:MAG: acyl carrier protein [Oscillospiraceae bacterium]|jgi:acyl carrier protein|nr:acyl carrier protein [Oscillospiraceae bacterium]
MVYDKVAELVIRQFKVSPDAVRPEARLLEDLRADSANVMMLVMDLEEAFDVLMEDDALLTVKTVGDLADYIEKKQQK